MILLSIIQRNKGVDGMDLEMEYLHMIQDTAQFAAKEKAAKLGDAAAAFHGSGQLANDVEFWRWMGANYPKDLSSSQLIQQAATNKSRWLNTQLQGKGYEWDFMAMQRSKPSNLFSVFEAGDCPTQPGIDVTQMGFDGTVKATYQNKAYLSSNNPDLHNTPHDAIVVTNKEKVAYAQKQGYKTEGYMDKNEIQAIRDSRFKQAEGGHANTTYNLQNVAQTAAKAGAVAAVIGMTVETLVSYRAWKSGELSDSQYLKEILKAGGDAGITGAATSVAMIPVQAAITVAGASTIIGIPVAIVIGSAINAVVAPCFGRGKYREILNEAKYYQALDDVYDDFIIAVEQAANQYTAYIGQMQLQARQYDAMKQVSRNMDKSLKDLYDLI